LEEYICLIKLQCYTITLLIDKDYYIRGYLNV
jgi:hypothetical protein